jgi:signal transduction histidine kinase/CheY-like chemotaxis protein
MKEAAQEPGTTNEDEARHLSAQVQRLQRFLAWDTATSFAGMVFVSTVYAVVHLKLVLPLIPIVGLNTLVLLLAFRRVRQGKLQQSILIVCVALWALTIAIAYALPGLPSLLSMLALWPIVLPLPFISGRALKVVLGTSVVVAFFIGLLLCRPQADLPSIPPLLLKGTVVVAMPVMAALFSFILWQYSTRLNEMLQNTRVANAALRESERSLEQKVRERTRELSEARDEALAATRAKTAFLANMSHELRTPLNAILGYSEMLQEDAHEQGRPEFVPDLKRIHAAGKHLLALINDVLDLSKVEAGRLELAIDTFSVPALVEEIAELIRPTVKPGVSLQITCDAAADVARTDQTKLRQALFNLLSNACKFTERGSVVLDVGRTSGGGGTEEGLLFRIRDTGIGMTVDELSRIFQPFSQGNASTARKYGGTGLGLALSRRFCQAMGGDISVASQPGKGSTFTLWIPADARAAAGAADADEGGRAAPPREAAAAGGKILVVDDDEPTRALLKRVLEKQGHLVHTAADGDEGLRMARSVSPDLITLDVLMPRMDGWTTLRLLKREAELAHIPVLLLTIVDQREHALAAGALDLLTKPVDRERLAAVVTRHARQPPSPREVLIVDDDRDVRAFLRRNLEKEAWVVSEAEDGQQALSQLAVRKPDLILLDLLMPTMDGFAFLDELARQGEGVTAPVVVLTAKDLTEQDRLRLGRSVSRILQKGVLSGEGVATAIGQVFAAASANGATAKA